MRVFIQVKVRGGGGGGGGGVEQSARGVNPTRWRGDSDIVNPTRWRGDSDINEDVTRAVLTE